MAGGTNPLNAKFQDLLDRVTRVRDVSGAFIVSAEDGLVVADSFMEGVRGNAVAALAASLFTRFRNASRASGGGVPKFLHLQADHGALVAMPGTDDVIVVAVADAGVNIGLLRLEMQRVVEAGT
jgi:predicted regulator of Ras-like GTPase activity (Roadblock/LC7/MglB family)